MRESEAKTKWCPHVRVAFPETTGNRDMQTPKADIYCCIGSNCMMWESEYTSETKEFIDHEVLSENTDGYRECNRIAERPGYVVGMRFVPTEFGDCGLKTKESECFYSG